MCHIKFKPETLPRVKDEIFTKYQSLMAACGGVDAGILRLTVQWNLETSQGIDLGMIAVFRSDEDLQDFLYCPAYQCLSNRMREIADWTIVDFFAPLDLS